MSYENWLKTEGFKDSNKTKKGYLKAPSCSTIIKWVNEAWTSMPSELIQESFKHAGEHF